MTAALRVLALVAPSPDAPFDAAAAWRQLAEALKPLEGQGLVSLAQVTPPTENALKKKLAAERWDVLHFIGLAKWRGAAQYGTLLLGSSTGASRSVGTQYFGDLLARNGSVKLVVLQTGTSGDSVWEHGPAVLLNAGAPSDPAQAVFARKFYASLATGSSPAEATAHARAASAIPLILQGGAMADAPVVSAPAGPPAAPAAPAAPPPPPPVAARSEADEARLLVLRELERKRAAGEFDVFLCHNSSDKPLVIRIADLLEGHGILPWLDERELPPGQPWQPLLEKQVASIRSAAVFVGAAGVGPWQEQELYGFLREFVARKVPVVPVLLQDAPSQPELPIFLRAMTWVDFRVPKPDPLLRLIWGITGRRPKG
ncbi:MAG TPA: toll/interleukin-1 receptor domain-containing protein [Thermoanaerobaculia bacterium]|nr:toll/interleukin-1 receptor domain-containing protein [Thermoanaerobaculia bacterium]